MGRAINRRRVFGGGGGIADYLAIVSTADNNTIKFFTSDSSNTRSIDVSTDGRTWETKTSSTAGTTLTTLDNGDKLFVKGVTSSYSNGTYYHHFEATGNFALWGNIMSMLYGDNFEGQTSLPSGSYTFYRMFSNCVGLVDISNLVMPATTLMPYCYHYMFYYCTNLTSIPQGLLPTTTLTEGCYYAMFYHCEALTTVPSDLLPATTLQTTCYRGMFSNCFSLNTTPILPAPTLAEQCYRNLFYNDGNVNYIKCLATNINAYNCRYGWVTGVAANGTFVKDANMTSWPTGTGGIPSGWTIQNA